MLNRAERSAGMQKDVIDGVPMAHVTYPLPILQTIYGDKLYLILPAPTRDIALSVSVLALLPRLMD